jgi:hypothetical protein
MLPFLKHHQASSFLEKPLLNQQELDQLCAFAAQLDTSATPSHGMDSRRAGWLPTKSIGSGMDYAESRVYQAGDDPRYINWRLSARTQETFVKTFHREATPSLCIMLDRRASMVFGTRCRLKITQAVRVATLLAYAAKARSIPLQVLILEHDVIRLEHPSMDEFLTLANQPPTSVAHSHPHPLALLETACHELQRHIPEGSLIYLLSDFYDLEAGQQENLVQLQENHVLQAVHIIDNAEMQLPPLGQVRLQDMQGNGQYSVKLQSKKIRDNFSAYAGQHADKIKCYFSDIGMACLRLRTDEENIHQRLSLPLGHT